MDSRALEMEKSRASEKEGFLLWGRVQLCGGFLFFPAGCRKLMITGDRIRIPREGSFKRLSLKLCITKKLKINIGLVLLQKEIR